MTSFQPNFCFMTFFDNSLMHWLQSLQRLRMAKTPCFCERSYAWKILAISTPLAKNDTIQSRLRSWKVWKSMELTRAWNKQQAGSNVSVFSNNSRQWFCNGVLNCPVLSNETRVLMAYSSYTLIFGMIKGDFIAAKSKSDKCICI